MQTRSLPKREATSLGADHRAFPLGWLPNSTLVVRGDGVGRGLDVGIARPIGRAPPLASFLGCRSPILFFLVPFFCAIVILFSCWFALRQSHRRAIDDRQ